jgi:hypothetical protein
MKDYTKDIGFWKRLQSFVSDVQTNCCMGEEEKQMIIHNCKLKILHLQNGSSSVDTGGIDKYFEDLEKWENSFYCNECGCDKITDFAYDRTVSNGEVWHCKHCKTETIVDNKPNEDRY